MKTYRDFIGEKIEIEISPFSFCSANGALKHALLERIKKELNYNNGLLCSFKDIQVSIDKKIVVTGVVTQCEVDC